MNIAVTKPGTSIERANPSAPILVAVGRTDISIRAGTSIGIDGKAYDFDADTPVCLSDLAPGNDYGIRLGDDGQPFATPLGQAGPLEAGYFAGLHFAPGGCAEARGGGDAVPAINPHSLWDLGFRPACPDPRGMVFVEAGDHRFWVDIYLLGIEHKINGTSRCGVRIADGNSLVRLNFKDAAEIYAGHGKRLLTYDEFRAAAFGITEKSAADRHPKTTGLDAPRTSRFGLMQATGNLWQWGTDGDPDDPRPSLFGGSWLNGGNAGSRCAVLGRWPENSSENISVRGGGDHLTLA